MNPCPCGYLGDPRRDCTCSDQRLSAYRSRVSGPLADRFDLRVEVPRADAHGAPGEPSEVVAGRVAAAHELLRDGRPALDGAGARLLEEAVERLAMSARGRERVQRVAGTIAALAGRDCAGQDDVAEALAYRLELAR
jgi:magnesium chelatase family protein